jgi:hypothetical protein
MILFGLDESADFGVVGVGNAVAHRDYSSYVRGSYIRVRLFADRLEIQSPGGLFGNVTEENLEEESSTRNSILMRLMENLLYVDRTPGTAWPAAGSFPGGADPGLRQGSIRSAECQALLKVA